MTALRIDPDGCTNSGAGRLEARGRAGDGAPRPSPLPDATVTIPHEPSLIGSSASGHASTTSARMRSVRSGGRVDHRSA
jgi:hypothetical protein